MGLERRSWRGLAIALIGGELLRHSFTGKSMLTRALDLTVESPNRDQIGAPPESPSVERAITIGGSPRELYDVWRDPSQLSRILAHWVEVTSTSPDRMHWSVRGPTGKSLEWEAQITDDRPGELIRWASLPGADVPNEGAIAFSPAPEGWGSEVQLSMRFDPPGGKIGEFVANHFGIAPRLGVERSLRRFKSLVETGEMPTLEHNVSARGAGDLW
jgi:uncharacterized membrane protein